MQDYIRWYDKNRFLSTFMILVENLPQDIQEEVALDIILNVSALKNKKCDFSFSNEGENILSCNRWYDKNSALHYAVKLLEELQDEQRVTVIQSVSDIILKYGIENSLFTRYESLDDE